MLHKIPARQIIKQLPKWPWSPWKVALPWMLTVPFIIQVGSIVGLVGYLSYRNGQQAVADLTNQLTIDFNQRVDQKLSSYLANARLANQLNSDAVRRGALPLNLENSNAQREQYLWQQMQLFDNLTWISLGVEQSGDSMGVWRPGPRQDLQISLSNQSTQHFGTYYAFDRQGKRTNRLKIEKPAFDPRTRPWYKEAIAAKQAVWTSIYPGFTPGTVFIAASQPLYAPNDQLVGVSATDISLQNIQTFLAQNPVSSQGQTFLMERSGLLVASSSQEPPFRLLTGQPPQRINTLESQTPLIQATAKALRREVGSFSNIQQQQKFYFDQGHQPQFVQVTAFAQKPGLDWLIVTVVPESDVMGKIHHGTKTTIGLCLAALLGVIVLNTLISRWLTQPIRRLSRASKKIAQGEFDYRVENSGIRELSTLATSFNQMSQEIQQSREQLEEYSRSLEQKVSDRTQALQAEIQQRQAFEVALQAANQELQNLAYLDGLTQIANRRRFDDQFLREWARMKREQLPLSLILGDVDYFKQYNDTYGHQLGDECLCQVAQAIAVAARRSSDLAARYGGEEFVVLLPNTPLVGAQQVATLMQANIAALRLPHANSAVSQYVTASFGVASIIPRNDNDAEQLLFQVDQALYEAKRSGRNQISDGVIREQ
jgi:diguanylate cyclase (GGDEF)-like protein